MAPVLKVFLEIQRILRFARDSIKRLPGGGVYLLALLGRKLTAWWRFWRGKLGSYGGKKNCLATSVGIELSSCSVSGASGSAVPGYVVAAAAASRVPQSASHPSLHERALADGQHLSTVGYPVGTHSPVIDSLTVEHPHGHNPHHPLGTRGLANRSSGSLSIASIQSRASSRFSIITTSRESIRDTTHGQPSRLPRATYRQFGRGPDPSRSRERSPRPSSRPNTPSSRPNTPSDRPDTPYPPRLEIITTNLPSAAHGSGRVGLSVPPSASTAYTHQPLSPPTRTLSSTSYDVDVQNPSTESLSMSPSANNSITEEPLAIEPATTHSSPDSSAHDELVPGSPTSSNAEQLPEGRFVQLIHSDQVPRYTKDVFMQV